MKNPPGPSIYRAMERAQEKMERHVVLVAPQIHWNTGNAGRTCLAAGARLHLVKPLGFSLDSKHVKRAGLDYWDDVDLTVWDSWEDLAREMALAKEELALFSKRGERPFWEMPRARRMFLVFGSETLGLPPPILEKYPDATYYIPITQKVRSLNLSTAAGIALFESLRGASPLHQWASFSQESG